MSKLLFYSSVCPDTKAFVEELERLDIPYESINITESMKNLKAFLKHRDFQKEFDEKKDNNQVGVPVLLVHNDHESRYIFDLSELKNI
ncbi:glutaredoxin domain-containing protein [Aerococcaceae bacterium WGS1372]